MEIFRTTLVDIFQQPLVLWYYEYKTTHCQSQVNFFNKVQYCNCSDWTS